MSTPSTPMKSPFTRMGWASVTVSPRLKLSGYALETYNARVCLTAVYHARLRQSKVPKPALLAA